MSRINRVPFGLQDLLGSTNFGDNPSELSSVVAPTLDMFQFLASERRSVTYGSTVTRTTNGDGSIVVVPEGETWLIWNAGALLSTLGTDPKRCRLGLVVSNVRNSPSPAQRHAVADLGLFEDAAGGNTSHPMMAQFGTVWPAFGGETFIVTVSDINATGTNSYGTRVMIWYTRLRV